MGGGGVCVGVGDQHLGLDVRARACIRSDGLELGFCDAELLRARDREAICVVVADGERVLLVRVRVYVSEDDEAAIGEAPFERELDQVNVGGWFVGGGFPAPSAAATAPVPEHADGVRRVRVDDHHAVTALQYGLDSAERHEDGFHLAAVVRLRFGVCKTLADVVRVVRPEVDAETATRCWLAVVEAAAVSEAFGARIGVGGFFGEARPRAEFCNVVVGRDAMSFWLGDVAKGTCHLFPPRAVLRNSDPPRIGMAAVGAVRVEVRRFTLVAAACEESG